MASTQSMALWPREALAGSVAALVTLALLVSLGVLAFSPLGVDAARIGASAALTTSALSALVYAISATSRLPTGASTSPTSLMIASLLASMLLDPATQAPRVAWLLAAVALAVMTMGLMQVAVALLGLVQLVRNVPQMVLAGFMNAIAVLVLLAQFGPLLGFTSMTLVHGSAQAWAEFRPGSLLLGICTALLVWTVARRRPRWPAALIALISGAAVHQLAARMLPGVDLGPEVGAIARELPVFDAWVALREDACREFLLRHAMAITGTGAAMALVGVLESIMVVLALDRQFGDRSDTRRELLCIGVANLLGGLFGALPLGAVRSRAAAVLQAGGDGRGAAVSAALASAALFFFGLPLLAWLPVAVFGGIMLTVAWALVDPWTLGLVRKVADGERSPDLGLPLAVVTIVLVTTVWRGPLFGVCLGIAFAVLLFIRQLSCSPVRSCYSGAQRPSRRVYPAAIEAQLVPLRPAIGVLELEGPLFFGNAEQVDQAADALPAGTALLVLDLRRVSTVDDTGAHVLAQLAPRLQRRSTRLLLAGVQSGRPLGQRLHLFGVAGQDGRDWFADADLAIEAAEHLLLSARPSPSALPPDATANINALLHGLGAEDIDRVRAHLQPMTLAAGEHVFRQGDAADSVYLVVRGSVSIVAPRINGLPGPRYASLSPGTLFGEAAMLDGGGRSADAVTDTETETELLCLNQTALTALAQAHPELGTLLYRNMASYLAQRLRIASAAWTAAAG